MAVGAQSYRPDPTKQALAREQIALHRELDLGELFTFIGSDLIRYLDEYQVNTPDLRSRELPKDVDSHITDFLKNNTSIYGDEVEDLLDSDPVYIHLLAMPASEERSSAVRARRSVIVLSLLALKDAPSEVPAMLPNRVA